MSSAEEPDPFPSIALSASMAVSFELLLPLAFPSSSLSTSFPATSSYRGGESAASTIASVGYSFVSVYTSCRIVSHIGRDSRHALEIAHDEKHWDEEYDVEPDPYAEQHCRDDLFWFLGVSWRNCIPGNVLVRGSRGDQRVEPT